VAADDDVFNAQHVNRELNCRKAIEISVHHDIGYVACTNISPVPIRPPGLRARGLSEQPIQR